MYAITVFTVASLVLGFWSGSVDAQAAATDPTLVKTDAGAVRGVVAGDVISFEGAPYAPPGRQVVLASAEAGATLAGRADRRQVWSGRDADCGPSSWAPRRDGCRWDRHP
jgi:hypothetical protein